MQIILIKDLKGRGKKGDMINVNDGYAVNYLFPNGIAQPANSANINVVKNAKAAETFKQETIKNAAQELSKKINNTTINIKVKLGENGKMFGSVTNKEISSELEKIGFDVDKKCIIMEAPIKTTGKYQLKIKLHAEAVCKININVTE